MPVENGIGYGDYTPAKIENFGIILAMHMKITQAVIKKHSFDPVYRYIDLTAGKGGTPDGTKGSPIVFLDKLADPKFDLPYRADLIEREHDHIEELQKVVWSHPMCIRESVHFHPGNYEDVVLNLLKSRKPYELGLVYVDPTGKLPDFKALGFISDMRPKMEILLNLSATNVKRRYSHTQKFLADFLSETHKQNWLIRKPFRGDSHQWTLLLGSNSDLFKPHKSIQNYFYLLNSPEGQYVFERMNLNQEQRTKQYQPPLF